MLVVLPLSLFVWRNVFSYLVVCRCGMVGSNEDHDRNRRPGVEDQNGQAHVGY
jgi:hypothetical protein